MPAIGFRSSAEAARLHITKEYLLWPLDGRTRFELSLRSSSLFSSVSVISVSDCTGTVNVASLGCGGGGACAGELPGGRLKVWPASWGLTSRASKTARLFSALAWLCSFSASFLRWSAMTRCATGQRFCACALRGHEGILGCSI